MSSHMIVTARSNPSVAGNFNFMRTGVLKKSLAGAFALASLTLVCGVAQAGPVARCYLTGGNSPLRVCHHPTDEGIYYNTPANRVAYNVQIMKLSDSDYYTVYHGESKAAFDDNKPRSGDSIKTALANGPFTYTMPPNPKFTIWGSLLDTTSGLYYGLDVPNANAKGTSGGGNPIAVMGRGWAGDTTIYTFFLGVSSPDFGSNNWRHFLYESRSHDLINTYLKSAACSPDPWCKFDQYATDAMRRPMVIQDTANNTIQSNQSAGPETTTGLIGSIVVINQVYHYFYTDLDPVNSGVTNLYVRTALDVSGNSGNFWSLPTKLNKSPLPNGTLIRVAKAKDMNRWALFYNCYDQNSRSDICLQYTENLELTGAGGIASLDFFTDGNLHSPFYMGLNTQSCPYSARAQHYFMTDVYGGLASPNGEAATTRGGMLTWMDMCSGPDGPFGSPVVRAGWDVTVP